MRASLYTKIWIVTIFAISYTDTKGQGVINDRIEKEIGRLNIDTTLIYSFNCVGCSTSDSCSKEQSHYLFWKKNGRYYVKRFDYCKDFATLTSAADNPLGIYINDNESINTEEIRPPT